MTSKYLGSWVDTSKKDIKVRKALEGTKWHDQRMEIESTPGNQALL